MDIRQLRTFHRVAALGSFTRAAAELNYAQSSVTAQIKSLEVSLGSELFERVAGKVKLTPAGTRLLPYAGRCCRSRTRRGGWRRRTRTPRAC